MKYLEDWIPTICLTVLLAVAIACHASEDIQTGLVIALLTAAIWPFQDRWGDENNLSVREYTMYTVTAHAKDRILTRFNITNKELDVWIQRLLQQCTYVETQSKNRAKYRLNDIVVIVDPKKRAVVTVYSENAYDDIPVNTHTNPEIKSAINRALEQFSNKKKVETAKKIHQDLAKMLSANERMINPGTTYLNANNAWDDFVAAFDAVKSKVDSGRTLISEAEARQHEG